MVDMMGTYLSKSEKEEATPPGDQNVAATVAESQVALDPQISEDVVSDDSSLETRRQENVRKLEVFKEELAAKREVRRKAIAAAADKLAQLQLQLDAEQEARLKAEQEATHLKERLSDGEILEELERERNKVNCLEKELESEKRWRLQFEEEREKREEAEQQVHSLKELTSIGKEMLRIRELEVNEMRRRLCETQYPEDLRDEYEAQLENVKRLRNLYESRVEEVRFEQQQEIDKEISTIKSLESKVRELEEERQEAESMREHLKERVLKLDRELEVRNDAANALQEQLDASITECRDLTSQVNSVSNLFAQILAGDSGVTDMETSDQQPVVDELTCTDGDESGVQVQERRLNATQAEKIWEMLVHHRAQDGPTAASSESCYKSVDTPSGKRSVISVSQTYLTLKNLILEKKALMKEVNNLKVLNEHLETRLGGQERRLTTVSSELKKTWGVVSKLRVQHKQLHTQEKILRYELQHKRLLLTDLKVELEQCKEIWDMARQKNCQSEEEWRKLRKEFAERRNQRHITNNSVESGYEDEESNSPPTEENTDSDTREHSHNTDVLTPDYVDSENDEGSLATRTDDVASDIDAPSDDFPNCPVAETHCTLNEQNTDLQGEVTLNKTSTTENVSKFLEGLIETSDSQESQPTNCIKPEQSTVQELRKEDYSESSICSITSSTVNTCGASASRSTNDLYQTNSTLSTPESSCVANGVSKPSTTSSKSDSSECSVPVARTTEQVLDARTERLKRLEEQCKLLFTQVTATTIKSNVLSSKLELLHEQYGRSDEDDFAESKPDAHSTNSKCGNDITKDDTASER